MLTDKQLVQWYEKTLRGDWFIIFLNFVSHLMVLQLSEQNLRPSYHKDGFRLKVFISHLMIGMINI